MLLVPGSRPRMIVRRTVTSLASIRRKPRMSNPSITAPSVLTVRSPLWIRSAVPSGTPVLVGPGRPDGGTVDDVEVVVFVVVAGGDVVVAWRLVVGGTVVVADGAVVVVVGGGAVARGFSIEA